jgi:DnaA-like protein
MGSWVNSLSMDQCNELLAETYDLDAKQTGALMRIVGFLRKNGAIPFVERRLAMVAGVTRAYWTKTAWPIFQRIFQVDPDGNLFHPDIRGLRGRGSYPPDTEADRRSVAGKIAANARWGGRASLNVVPAYNGPEGDAIASESHAGNGAISSTSAYASDAISDAIVSPAASAGASPSDADRISGASAASRAPSLSQQRDSLREGSKTQVESLGERERARAPMRSDATPDAIPDATGGAIASESHAPLARPARPKTTPIPRDWEPSLEGVAAAQRKGLDASLVAANFRNWHIGHGLLQADWDARFLVWLEREQEQDASRRQGNMAMPIAGTAPEPPEDPATTVAWSDPHDPDNPALVAPWAAMRPQLRDASRTEWAMLRQMVLNGLDGDEIVISLPSTFLRDWVRQHYGERITALWKQAYPEARRVDFRVNNAV